MAPRVIGLRERLPLLFLASMLFVGLIALMILQPPIGGEEFAFTNPVGVCGMGSLCVVPLGLCARGV